MRDNGKIAELKTAIYLRKKGYNILEHNYRSRFGEIDLVVSNDDYVIFVEVKQRSEGSIALPREFVDENKQKRIIATASKYISQYDIKSQLRFDVVEVYVKNNKIKSIKHLENAFSLV